MSVAASLLTSQSSARSSSGMILPRRMSRRIVPKARPGWAGFADFEMFQPKCEFFFRLWVRAMGKGFCGRKLNLLLNVSVAPVAFVIDIMYAGFLLVKYCFAPFLAHPVSNF